VIVIAGLVILISQRAAARASTAGALGNGPDHGDFFGAMVSSVSVVIASKPRNE